MSKEIVTMKEWEKKMALIAKEDAAKESSTGLSGIISTKNKQFTLGDAEMGSEMEVVIAGASFENAYYDRPWEAGVYNPPACFAVGDKESTMAPDPTSPNKQSDTCSTCDFNQFGSSGNGKMCKNSRRLFIFPYHDGSIDTTEAAMLKLAPTSLKNYVKYTKLLAVSMGRPVWGVVTKLSFNEKIAYPVVIPSFVKAIDSVGDLDSLMAQADMTKEALMAPIDVSAYEAPTNNASRSKMS